MAPALSAETLRIVYAAAAVVILYVLTKVLRAGSREAHLPPGVGIPLHHNEKHLGG